MATNGNGNNGNGQAIQKAPQSFKEYLELRKQALQGVLPRHLTPERVVKVALVAYNKTPKLRECTMESLFLAIMQAAELGLEPGGALGHAYLVPYKDQCQLIPGYRGLIELARRSGEIESIEAHVVHERDKFTLRFGLNAALDHEPHLEGDPGEMRFVYAVAKLKGGATQFEVMTKDQVDKIKSRSRASNNGPWVTDYEEMARKTVVRRLIKYLPLSTERAEPLAKALELEDEGPVIDVAADVPALPPAQTRTAAVLDRVKGQTAQAAPATPEPAAQVTGTGEPPKDVKPPTTEQAPEVHASPNGKVTIIDMK